MAFDYNAYNEKYKQEHYDRVHVRLPKGDKEKLKAYCAGRGESVNAFLSKLIHAAMNGDIDI